MKSTSGAFDHLETGTNVVISWDLGIPMIIGCVDFVGAAQTAIAPPSITGVEGYGDADPTQVTHGSNSYKPPTAPTDQSGGDWAQVGSLGNHVAVLGGGMTSMGSPTAMIRTFGVAGTLQAIARRMESMTDFGQWRVENNQGRTSFILRAGSNQATETGYDEQNWTIQLDLGATGDILDFKITEPMGKVLFRLHAGADGRVQLYGDGGVDISSGGQGVAQTRHDIAGSRVAEVMSDDTVTVRGNQASSVEGDSATEVAGDVQHIIGGAETSVIGGDRASSVGGGSTHVTTGDLSTLVGGDAAADLQGDVAMSIVGKLLTEVGKTMELRASGKAVINGSHIDLGNGAHPLPKFDTFLRDFAEFLNHLISAIGQLVPSNPFGLAIELAMMQRFIIMASQGFPYISRKVSNE
jgi:hypothetical protein